MMKKSMMYTGLQRNTSGCDSKLLFTCKALFTYNTYFISEIGSIPLSNYSYIITYVELNFIPKLVAGHCEQQLLVVSK